MKIAISSALLLFLSVFASATEKPTNQIIVSYPERTADTLSCLEEAKKAVLDAGGVILHDYNIIVGFAAKLPAHAAKALKETIKTAGAEHKVLIEQDQTVSINN